MLKRAAIYARFSSDRQNERSCADQIALCEAWAARQGLTVTATYEDAAVSGASTVNRFGLASLMRDARARRFDVVVSEALDRLSRDQADLATIKKQLAFVEIGIMTVQDGEVGAMHIGLKGLMGELYLADLAQKTRRGLSARVAAGASGGGRSYGYAPVPGEPGRLQIVAAEAEVVRRIFEDYVAGTNPRAIAAALNAEGVPSPRGRAWNASTIHGSKSRANGILANGLYAGEIVWNRQRFIKDPATGKRVSRLNPESEWQRHQVPDLAIVPPELFAAAQGRKADRTFVKHQTPAPAKPKHLLSGLIKCGCCGASYTIVGRDRLGCTGYRERGDCDNNRTVTRRHIEERVLNALEVHLADPEMIAEYVREYHRSLAEFTAATRKDRTKLTRRAAELGRQIEQIVDRILAGTVTPAIEARLPGLEAERAEIEAQLAEAESATQTITLHPGAAENYRRIIVNLRSHLDGIAAGTRTTDELIAKVREHIVRVVVRPAETPKAPVDLTIEGRLAEFLIGSSGAPQYRGALVAGAGFEPAAFRL